MATNPHLPDESRPQLSPQEADALHDYTHWGSSSLNKDLHKGEPLWSKANVRLHRGLMSAFAEMPHFKEPVQAYRIADMDTADEANAFMARMKEAKDRGIPAVFRGYTSTSTLPKYVDDPETGQHPAMVRMRINAVRGLDAMPYSRIPHEHELLLPHHSRFLVRHIGKNQQGWPEIHLDQLPDPEPTEVVEHPAGLITRPRQYARPRRRPSKFVSQGADHILTFPSATHYLDYCREHGLRHEVQRPTAGRA